MEGRGETLGEVAWELLQRVVREKLARRPGAHLIEQRLESLELRLGLPLGGPEADARSFARQLDAAIDRLLDDAVEQVATFRPGHAYCHRCERAGCEHSLPPSCRHVFVGYTPTGTPRWEDFAQYCLDSRHPRVDKLYDEPPALITLVQDRRSLLGTMLDAFQNDALDLVGQLTVGFFSVRSTAEEGRGVLAVSVQVVASRRGLPRVDLNLLGRSPSGHGLERLWDRHEELPWRKSIRWAQSALQTLVPRRGARGQLANDLEQRVVGILQGLGRRLEREHRARSRRTRHAERRHVSGKRPTPKAIDDARAVGDHGVMLDARSDTVVVLGDRGRTHFFTRGGQLVSSVRYSRDAIARKLKQEQWRELSRDEILAFRELVERDAGGAGDAGDAAREKSGSAG
jgi:hypothetical protein